MLSTCSTSTDCFSSFTLRLSPGPGSGWPTVRPSPAQRPGHQRRREASSVACPGWAVSASFGISKSSRASLLVSAPRRGSSSISRINGKERITCILSSTASSSRRPSGCSTTSNRGSGAYTMHRYFPSAERLENNVRRGAPSGSFSCSAARSHGDGAQRRAPTHSLGGKRRALWDRPCGPHLPQGPG